MGTFQLKHPSTRVKCHHNNSTKATDKSDWYFDDGITYIVASVDPVSNSVYQTGTGYSSNNAGDGPEKTRDRKSWFPRFKSNWLGTFRSKQMFQCCECAVVSASNNTFFSKQAGRYKGAEGKHCRCGKDQWHLAKSVEEIEYNRRMEISKAFGGMRYDEAVVRLRSMGQSELDFKPSKLTVNIGSPIQSRSTRGFTPSSLVLSSSSSFNPPKRARSKSNGPLPTSASRTYAAPQLIKADSSTLPTMPYHVYGYENPAKQYGVYNPVYGNENIEYAQAVPQQQHAAEYNQLTPAPFGDEDNFGELLQGILEDDTRVATSASMGLGQHQANSYSASRYGYCTGAPSNISVAPSNISVAPLKRAMSMPSYAMTPSAIAPPSREGVEQEYYADANRRSSASLGVNHVPSYTNYRPTPQHQPVLQQVPYQLQQQHPSQQQQYTRPLSMTHSIATAPSASFST